MRHFNLNKHLGAKILEMQNMAEIKKGRQDYLIFRDIFHDMYWGFHQKLGASGGTWFFLALNFTPKHIKGVKGDELRTPLQPPMVLFPGILPLYLRKPSIKGVYRAPLKIYQIF